MLIKQLRILLLLPCLILVSCKGKRQIVSQLDRTGEITITKYFKKDSDAYTINLSFNELKEDFFESIIINDVKEDYHVTKYRRIQVLGNDKKSFEHYLVAVTDTSNKKFYCFDKEIVCGDLCYFENLTARELEVFKLFDSKLLKDRFTQNLYSRKIIGFIVLDIKKKY